MRKDEIANILKNIKDSPKKKNDVLSFLIDILGLRQNPYHPLVFINGKPKIGRNVYIGFFTEINAKGSTVIIGDSCDIASFVSINVADSHKRCIGISKKIERNPVVLENNVFVGSHSFIGGTTHIGHHSVVGAGTLLVNKGYISPYSLITGNPAMIKEGYYLRRTGKRYRSTL